jgi:DNA processing protein
VKAYPSDRAASGASLLHSQQDPSPERKTQAEYMENDSGQAPGMMEEEAYWLWLCSCPDLYRSAITALLRYFGSVRDIYQAPVSALDPWKKTGSQAGLKWAGSLAAHKQSKSPEQLSEALRQKGISFVSSTHPDFPPSLRHLPDCPFGLFYRGRLPDPVKISVAVIGARCCSNYGYQMADLLSRVLTEQGCQIISGMAVGIDGAAQSACIKNGGSSYAVLGCGVDICYPPEHTELYSSLPAHGGILSEYAPGTRPIRGNFPVRNRLISGLADAVVVVEAREKSGSLITADLALEQGKDVYAVPGRCGDRLSLGCNRLIEQGAGIILSPDNLLENLSVSIGLKRTGRREKCAGACSKAPAGLSPEEQAVFNVLTSDAAGAEEIAAKASLPLIRTLQILVQLQLKNCAVELSRNRYAGTAGNYG